MVDVGCGIGGSSRHIARKFGCTAKGITLSPVQVGVNLTWLVGHTESPLAEACLLAIVGSCLPQLAVQPVLLPGLSSPYAALPGRCSDLRIAWVKAGIKQHCHGCTVWPTGNAKSWPFNPVLHLFGCTSQNLHVHVLGEDTATCLCSCHLRHAVLAQGMQEGQFVPLT